MRNKLRNKMKLKKKLYAIRYSNKNGDIKINYIWAYKEKDAINEFLKHAEKTNIISVDESEEAIW